MQLIKLKNGLKSLSTIPEVSDLIKRCSSKIDEYFTSDDEFKWRGVKDEIFSGKMINDYFPAEYKYIVPRKYSDYLLRKNKNNFGEIFKIIDKEKIDWHQFRSVTFIESIFAFLVNHQINTVGISNMTIYNLKVLVKTLSSIELKDKILVLDNLEKLIKFIKNKINSSKDSLFLINCRKLKKEITDTLEAIK